jgi:hypothetical protein
MNNSNEQRVTSYEKWRSFFWLLVMGCGLLHTKIVLACPGCTELTKFGKDAVQTMRFGNGIAWSMLLLFAVPVCLVGGMVGTIVYLQRRSLSIQKNGNQPSA